VAIQKTFTADDTGATYPTAYWRITGVTFPPGLQTAVVAVAAYADATAAGADRVPLDTRRFTVGSAAYDQVFPPAAKVSEITARAYAWLKARQEFAGGTDA
jgi:deoxyribose-phosphate aldolase